MEPAAGIDAGPVVEESCRGGDVRDGDDGPERGLRRGDCPTGGRGSDCRRERGTA